MKRRDPILEHIKEANRAMGKALEAMGVKKPERLPCDAHGFPVDLVAHPAWVWMREGEMPEGNGAIAAIEMRETEPKSGVWRWRARRHGEFGRLSKPAALGVTRTAIVRTGVLFSEGYWRQRTYHPIRHGVVYFMRAVDGGPIKIGFTSRPLDQRSAEIRPAYPHALYTVLTIPGPASLETRIHRKFRHLRLEGEWFQPTPELLAFIDGQRSSRGS